MRDATNSKAVAYRRGNKTLFLLLCFFIVLILKVNNPTQSEKSNSRNNHNHFQNATSAKKLFLLLWRFVEKRKVNVTNSSDNGNKTNY